MGLNETYKTTPIVYSLGHPEKTADAIEAALLALPNNAIDGVYVNSTSITGYGTDGGANPNANDLLFDTSFLVYFTGASVQGPQNLLMVDVVECKDGCTPMLNGIDVKSYGTALSAVTEYKPADYNNYECGRRGKCTTTRASATASRATPATSARSRPRSSRHTE